MGLHLVVATDGSEGALHAAKWVSTQFKPSEVEVELLAVVHEPVDMGSSNFGPTPTMSSELDNAAAAEARASVQATEKILASFHPKTTVIGGRSVVPALVEYLKRGHPTALVVGRTGGRLHHLLGSVSAGMAKESPVPVWIIPT